MNPLKKFIFKEVYENLKSKAGRKKMMESSKTLFESVTLLNKANSLNESSKKKLAEKAVKIAENTLLEDYRTYIKECDCGEGEGKMLRAQLLSIMSNAEKLYHMVDEDDQFEDWIQSKVTIAEDYMRVAYSYLTYYNADENGGEVTEDDWNEEPEWHDMEGNEIEYSDDGWDDVEEDDMEYSEETPMGHAMNMSTMRDIPAVDEPEYIDALSADLDDDEIFEQVTKKNGKR